MGSFHVVTDENSSDPEAAAQGFGEQVIAFDADTLGCVAAAAREGGAQFADAGVLATLYNADETRAIRNRRQGGILTLPRAGMGRDRQSFQ